MWRKLLTEPFRGVALVLLWLPIKFARIIVGLLIFALGLDLLQSSGSLGDLVTMIGVILALGVVHATLPRLHHWLRTAGR